MYQILEPAFGNERVLMRAGYPLPVQDEGVGGGTKRVDDLRGLFYCVVQATGRRDAHRATPCDVDAKTKC